VSTSMTSTMAIFTTIRHELGLDSPVSASSRSPLQSLQSLLRLFGTYFSIIIFFHPVVNSCHMSYQF
jgi:hypothetical protein